MDLPDSHALLPGSGLYRGILVIGLLLGAVAWWRVARRDSRRYLIYVGAILGGFLGAKLVFLAAEGWLYIGTPDFLIALISGKTIVGALLGGYAGVEFVKASIGYTEPTGDWFGLAVPLGIGVGRLGCLDAGCCRGIELASGEAWPAPWVELGFNALAFVALLAVRRRPRAAGQTFHLYLIAYGLFRLAHEPLRATAKPFAGLSGYQLAAFAMVLFAGWRLWVRDRQWRSRQA